MMRCPVCKADNDQSTNCRRCRADLASLFELEKQQRRVLDGTYRCLAAGQVKRAFAIADGSRALQDSVEARRVAATSLLMAHDFAGAWRMYHSSTTSD
jgi:hypothetical protein